MTHYLVKWCSLSYEESTWELQEDVDPGKIQEFEDNKKIPELKHVVRAGEQDGGVACTGNALVSFGYY